MTSAQYYPRTISEKPNRDNKKIGAFQKEVLGRFSVNGTYQGLVIKIVQIGYSTG